MKHIFFLLPLFSTLAFGQYKLALNLQTGSVYAVSIQSNTRFDGSVNGEKTVVSAMMTGVMRFRVTGATDSGYLFSVSCDSMKFSLKSPLGKMEFSSGDSSTEDGQVSEIAKKMSGAHFTIMLLKNGAVHRFDHSDTSGMAAMMKHLPMAEMIKKFLMARTSGRTMSRQMMKENFEKYTTVFPDKKVSVNDTWGSEISMDTTGKKKIVTNYQLTGYGNGNGIATIKGHRESGSANADKQQKMKSETESLMTFNSTTGWIHEGQIRTMITGEMGNHNKSGINTPFTVVTTTKLTGY